MKQFVLFLLAIIAIVFIMVGAVLLRSHEIAPLVYSPIYPFFGICFMLAGIILLVAFVFKWHHNTVPKMDLVKSFILALGILTLLWYFVAPYSEKFLHKLYRKEVKAEIVRRIKGIFSSGTRKAKHHVEPEVEKK
jgi:hypothetical protein